MKISHYTVYSMIKFYVHAHTNFRGCLVNAKDEDGNTLLHCAAENGHTMSIRILLNAGAKLNVKNDLDDTPVHAAAENGHLQ